MVWNWPFNSNKNEEQSQQNSNNQQPQFQTKTYFHSYSSSRTCRPNEQDQNYMICKQTIKDGNNVSVREERVPRHQAHNVSYSSNMNFNSDQFNQIFQGFDNVLKGFPVFGASMFPASPFWNTPFPTFQNPSQSTQTNFNVNPSHQNTHKTNDYKTNKQTNSHYFSTKKQKDLNIKDL